MTHRGPVLVTGAAGFIGSHTVEALLSRGERVVGIDNFDPLYDVAIKARNVADSRRHPRAADAYQFIETDIRDESRMAELFDSTKPSSVIHLAARAGVRPSIADPVGYTHVNVLATSVLLKAAERAGCDRFVLASSSSVYGNNPKTPFAETDDVSCPISPYAATKRACELLAHSHWSLTRMPTACLRFFTVFGPRQRPDLAISMFLGRVGAGQPITMFGDGSTSRDYTYIDDIVTGVLASHDRITSHGYRIWNLGGSEPVSLATLIRAIGATVGKDPRIEQKPMQPGDVERTFADLARSRAELDFAPKTRLTDGLSRQWAWMQSVRTR
jgi:UDP-glucuronate 4-epimerase